MAPSIEMLTLKASIADDIAALINASPRSPTKEQIGDVVMRHLQKLPETRHPMREVKRGDGGAPIGWRPTVAAGMVEVQGFGGGGGGDPSVAGGGSFGDCANWDIGKNDHSGMAHINGLGGGQAKITHRCSHVKGSNPCCDICGTPSHAWNVIDCHGAR
jgi:hypothetical protein